jgi:hypothetical protein
MVNFPFLELQHSWILFRICFTSVVLCCCFCYDFGVKLPFVLSIRVMFYLFYYAWLLVGFVLLKVLCVVLCGSLFVRLSVFFWPLYCLSFFFWPLYCLSFFFWPLYCLSFFDLRLLITPLVSSTFLFDKMCFSYLLLNDW